MSLYQSHAHCNTKQNIIKSEHANIDNKKSLIETNNVDNVSKTVPLHINTNKPNSNHIP